MNKKTSLVLSAALLFALTGCGSKKEDKQKTEEVVVVEQQAATETQEEPTRDAKELMEQPADTQSAPTE